MTNEEVFAMSFTNVYNCLIAKAERKNKTRHEVNELTSWLTGYSIDEIESLITQDPAYGDFFRNAPELNEKRDNIAGSICGVKIAEIEDPLMKLIRQEDKLIDELAKGKTVEKILVKYEK